MQRSIQSDRFESNRKRILDDAGFTKATLLSKMGGAGGGSSKSGASEMPSLEDDL